MSNLAIYLIVGVAIIIVLLFLNRNISQRGMSADRLNILLKRNPHIKEKIEQAKKAYSKRKLSKQEFKRIIEKYEQELIESDGVKG